MRIAAIIGLVMAVPLAFVVIMTQVNTLQDTAKGVVPAAVDPIFGPTTFIILLLTILIGGGLIFAAMSFIMGR